MSTCSAVVTCPSVRNAPVAQYSLCEAAEGGREKRILRTKETDLHIDGIKRVEDDDDDDDDDG